jgi:hypothetical protein
MPSPEFFYWSWRSSSGSSGHHWSSVRLIVFLVVAWFIARSAKDLADCLTIYVEPHADLIAGFSCLMPLNQCLDWHRERFDLPSDRSNLGVTIEDDLTNRLVIEIETPRQCPE